METCPAFFAATVGKGRYSLDKMVTYKEFPDLGKMELIAGGFIIIAGLAIVGSLIYVLKS